VLNLPFAIMEGNFDGTVKGVGIQDISHHACAWANISLFEN